LTHHHETDFGIITPQVVGERTGSAAAMKGLTMPKGDATLSAASAGSASVWLLYSTETINA
jgi:hypothetical protein